MRVDKLCRERPSAIWRDYQNNEVAHSPPQRDPLRPPHRTSLTENAIGISIGFFQSIDPIILAGLTNTIDPQFVPWLTIFIYAKQFAKEELTGDGQGWWVEIIILGKNIWRLPSRMEQLLTRANQGALSVQVSLSRETRKAIRHIDTSVRRFAWMVIVAGLLVSSVNMHIAGKDRPYGIILIILSVVTFLWGIRK